MNLLADRCLPVLVDGQVQVVDLAELLALYAADRVDDLPFLRPHQRAPWHSFLVLLAALALHRAGLVEPPTDPARWRHLLRALTPDWPDDEPWRPVVDDLTRPAFLQPPVPKGTTDPYKNLVATPDDLDVLVNSRNHGLKQALAAMATPATWLAALVSLQTTGGFLGSGNYGIARMNGGFATRPSIGLVPEGGPGRHWWRDVQVLLAKREWFFGRVDEFLPEGGLALLWCLPWDGETSLGLDQLDPWFIEICRRVRLKTDRAGALVAWTSRSEATRIAAKTYNGNVGDPWTPIRLTDGAAYNTRPTYEVISAVLFDQGAWLRPLLLDWHAELDPPVMTARFDVVIRGQGVTEGHWLREVRFEGQKQRSFLMIQAERDRAAELARQMVEDVRNLRGKVVRIALLTLAQGAPDELKFKKHASVDWVEPWVGQVEEAIEPVFFDHLFARLEGSSGAEEAWGRRLQDIAWAIFHAACRALPITGSRRLKTIAVAELKLAGMLHRLCEPYLDKETEDAA